MRTAMAISCSSLATRRKGNGPLQGFVFAFADEGYCYHTFGENQFANAIDQGINFRVTRTSCACFPRGLFVPTFFAENSKWCGSVFALALPGFCFLGSLNSVSSLSSPS